MPKEPTLIAIIDDEESVRKALARLLHSVGMKAETFSGGGEFLEALGTHRPACAVLDLHMPGMNGFELLERLNSPSVRVPVVVITGHDTPEAEERALRGGAAAYLRKPINQALLLDAINSAIARGGKRESENRKARQD